MNDLTCFSHLNTKMSHGDDIRLEPDSQQIQLHVETLLMLYRDMDSGLKMTTSEICYVSRHFAQKQLLQVESLT